MNKQVTRRGLLSFGALAALAPVAKLLPKEDPEYVEYNSKGQLTISNFHMQHDGKGPMLVVSPLPDGHRVLIRDGMFRSGKANRGPAMRATGRA